MGSRASPGFPAPEVSRFAPPCQSPVPAPAAGSSGGHINGVPSGILGRGRDREGRAWEREPTVRRTLARSLAREGSEEAAELLIGKAKGEEKRNVLAALSTLEDPRALERLAREAIEAKDPEVVAACARALGRMKDERAVAALVPLLAPERPDPVRVAAAEALGLLGSATALASLRAVAAGEGDVGLAAKQAIARIDFVAGTQPSRR